MLLLCLLCMNFVCLVYILWHFLFMFCLCTAFFFFKQKTAYEMRISDWSSDVCSSDLSLVHSDPLPLFRNRPPVSARSTPCDGSFSATAGCRTAAPQIGRASCRERVCQYV